VGRGGAVCALDRKWGVAVAAVDGDKGWRRWSGEGLSSGRGIAVDWRCLVG
jgi:hypothetical protein